MAKLEKSTPVLLARNPRVHCVVWIICRQTDTQEPAFLSKAQRTRNASSGCKKDVTTQPAQKKPICFEEWLKVLF